MDKELVVRELEALYELVSTLERNSHEANGIYRAIEAVKRIPDDNAWIPVTERLPEDGDTVWVTAVYMGDLAVKESLYSNQCFLDQWGLMLNKIVTAWKPREVMLPYKEDA